ncbi:hypothetical protein PL321_15425 [Caloramator sp. mosi_1]|uniref:hypothetical protein n=1 Tax=Caloramator sp. mosi_1 TaxID=3023090 RepID=UPI00235F6E80|nr:hypothetical protein [Caloramator sp. mosi_1]WDC83851.1 hypothetical protein PL321_15425 [Caloramator sp. mosi_1]
MKSLTLQLLQTTLFVVLFLTYFELIRLAKIEKQKPVVGRPKPKPNRIKKAVSKSAFTFYKCSIDKII